jgi:hypothetical protein
VDARHSERQQKSAQSGCRRGVRNQSEPPCVGCYEAYSRDYREIKFPPLPGAEADARSVAKLLGGDCVLRDGLSADWRWGDVVAARVFRIVGAQTVLASHWKVSDKASSRLMTDFISSVGIGNLPTKILDENGSK